MRSSSALFIGVDGGGTKTAAALCNQDGEILAQASGDSTNMQSRPWPAVEATLHELTASLLAQAGARREQVAVILFGLAGADRPQARTRIFASFADWTKTKVLIDNDAVTALYSGTWGEPGIVLIAGTGSIASGVSRTGERFRVGGWGYLLGDEGSGFDLGRRGLTAVLRAYDGRDAPTAMTGLVLDAFGMASPQELIHMVYNADNPRKELAQASRLVLQAAEAGDETACRLVAEAVTELTQLAMVCMAKMQENVPVVLAGGLLSEDTPIRRGLEDQLAAERVDAIIPPCPPVIGTLVMSLREAGIPVDERVKQNMMRSWTGDERRG